MNIERLAELTTNLGKSLALVVTTFVIVSLMGRLAEDYPWLFAVAVLIFIIWPAIRMLWNAMMHWSERRLQQIGRWQEKNWWSQHPR